MYSIDGPPPRVAVALASETALALDVVDAAAEGIANEKVGGSATIATVSGAAEANKFTWLADAETDSAADDDDDDDDAFDVGDKGDANMASDEGADARSGERKETGELSAAAGAAATR